jgi:hypothetical protein
MSAASRRKPLIEPPRASKTASQAPKGFGWICAVQGSLRGGTRRYQTEPVSLGEDGSPNSMVEKARRAM